MWLFNRKKIGEGRKFGVGAFPDPIDGRDYSYPEVAFGAAPVDWNAGYDVEKELGITIPLKNQNGSSSCVGQGWSYYVGVLNAVEIGYYDEASAKAIYSQIHLSGGGAYIRDGGLLAVNWGALPEIVVPTYDNDKPPSEAFCINKDWKNENTDKLAKVWQGKEARVIKGEMSMDLVATAIRDNHGVAGGLYGANNGTWGSNEPKPPAKSEWGHCIYFGKFGTDEKGKYIATPNSWGTRGKDSLHPDGWQKLREDYFTSKYMFNPWTLVDKPNYHPISNEAIKVMKNNEKKVIMEAENAGRKGILVSGKLREIKDPTNNRATAACLYSLANNGVGQMVNTKMFDEIPKGEDF